MGVAEGGAKCYAWILFYIIPALGEADLGLLIFFNKWSSAKARLPLLAGSASCVLERAVW